MKCTNIIWTCKHVYTVTNLTHIRLRLKVLPIAKAAMYFYQSNCFQHNLNNTDYTKAFKHTPQLISNFFYDCMIFNEKFQVNCDERFTIIYSAIRLVYDTASVTHTVQYCTFYAVRLPFNVTVVLICSSYAYADESDAGARCTTFSLRLQSNLISCGVLHIITIMCHFVSLFVD